MDNVQKKDAFFLMSSLTHSLSLALTIHVSDTAGTSQDGFRFRMQGSEGCGMSLLGLVRMLTNNNFNLMNAHRRSLNLI